MKAYKVTITRHYSGGDAKEISCEYYSHLDVAQIKVRGMRSMDAFNRPDHWVYMGDNVPDALGALVDNLHGYYYDVAWIDVIFIDQSRIDR
jgi:hypothetical protein